MRFFESKTIHSSRSTIIACISATMLLSYSVHLSASDRTKAIAIGSMMIAALCSVRLSVLSPVMPLRAIRRHSDVS